MVLSVFSEKAMMSKSIFSFSPWKIILSKGNVSVFRD